MSASRGALLLLWVVPALWSANYIIARLAVGVISPHQLALGRWSLALLLMLPFVAGELRQRWSQWRGEWWHLLVLGSLGMWICGAFVYQGGQSTSAINIGLIYAAAPVLIAVAGAELLHERMSGSQRLGLLFALAGVVFVVARGDLDTLLEVRFAAGDAWIVVAAVSWVAYSLLLRHWPSVLSPLARLAVITAAGLVVLVPFTVAEACIGATPALTERAWLLIAVAALVPGVLSYAAYSYLQSALGASRTALLLYLTPVYGALAAWLMLGERPGWHHAVGAALILPGIWLATRH
jgi:drug/metabolite transporter (DMT)-like permease